MRVEIVMPKWGLTMSEATIVRWICGEGEAVAEGDALVEVETEKANAEVPAPSAGVLARVFAEVGAVVPVGEVIAILETSGRPSAGVEPVAAATEARGPLPEPTPEAPREPAAEAAFAEARARASEESRASPLARRIARELGVDVKGISGTGKGGLITESDVRAAAGELGAAARAAELVPRRAERLAGMRKAIALAMSLSLTEGAQLTLTRQTGVTGALAVRERARDRATLTDVLVAAAARALVRHPALNAHLVGDELRLFDTVNVGIAVALDDGLVTPVVRDAHALALEELAARRRGLVEAARSRTLRQADLEDGTFTLTNLGAYGIDAFTPIINPPQVAILGVGAVRQRPVFSGGGILPREECVLSLTFDHRALDGAPAALFLAELAELLEDESRLEERLR